MQLGLSFWSSCLGLVGLLTGYAIGRTQLDERFPSPATVTPSPCEEQPDATTIGRDTTQPGHDSARTEHSDPLPAPELVLGHETVPGLTPVRDAEKHVAAMTRDTVRVELGRPKRLAPPPWLVLVARGDEAPTSLRARVDEGATKHWNITGQWLAHAEPVQQQLRARQYVDITREAGAGVFLQYVGLLSLEPSLSIQAGEAESAAVLLDGFESPRGEGAAPLWSVGSRSTLGLALSPTNGPYRLTVEAHAFEPIAPVEVRVRIDGRFVGTLTVGERLHTSTLAIPANILHSGINPVSLSYSRTGRPSELQGTSDQRELGIRLHALELHPSEKG